MRRRSDITSKHLGNKTILKKVVSKIPRTGHHIRYKFQMKYLIPPPGFRCSLIRRFTFARIDISYARVFSTKARKKD